jgi:hypothetical protein
MLGKDRKRPKIRNLFIWMRLILTYRISVKVIKILLTQGEEKRTEQTTQTR